MDVQYSRSAVMIDPVDLASDEYADFAVLPLFLVGEQVGNEQGQTWRRGCRTLFNMTELNNTHSLRKCLNVVLVH